jgi:hypothetical protein
MKWVRKTVSRYADSYWIPGVLAVAMLIIMLLPVQFGGCQRPVLLVFPALTCISILGMLVAGFFNIHKARWLKCAINTALVPFAVGLFLVELLLFGWLLPACALTEETMLERVEECTEVGELPDKTTGIQIAARKTIEDKTEYFIRFEASHDAIDEWLARIRDPVDQEPEIFTPDNTYLTTLVSFEPCWFDTGSIDHGRKYETNDTSGWTWTEIVINDRLNAVYVHAYDLCR